MVSFTSLSVLLLSAIAGIQASPIGQRDVPVLKCTTVSKGSLRTTNGHTLQLSNGQLKFGGSLEVEFQNCQPNFGKFTGSNGTPIAGHIYIPSTKKCLTANPTAGGGSGNPPFVFGQDDCYFSDDSGTIFSTFIKQKDGKIYYAGTTSEDGSYIFHGDTCSSGFFGVSSSATSGVAKFSCVNDGHIIGLNI